MGTGNTSNSVKKMYQDNRIGEDSRLQKGIQNDAIGILVLQQQCSPPWGCVNIQIVQRERMEGGKRYDDGVEEKKYTPR